MDPAAGTDNIQVAIENTGEVAAAGATQGAPGDNENALAIHSLANEPLVEGDKTFVDGYGRIAARVGTETRRNTMARDGASDTMNQLENLRESIVGVSIEEEMINLVMFQKGFEASSQYVQTIDEMLGTIIGLRR
jgi:flagellar hook-associated protein 1 FlgK